MAMSATSGAGFVVIDTELVLARPDLTRSSGRSWSGGLMDLQSMALAVPRRDAAGLSHLPAQSGEQVSGILRCT